MPISMKFNKPTLSIADQIALLQGRGLLFPDRERAERYLTAISYYRLSAYFIPFLDRVDHFIPETTFDQILDLYIYDRKLRLLAMDALERIEVAFRSIVSNTMCELYGAHWFMNDKHFRKKYRSKYGHGKLMGNIAFATGQKDTAKQNTACSHYYQTYCSPGLPPSWIVAEVLTMGTWSRIYEELTTKFQKKISGVLGFDKSDLESWIHALTLVRNNCVHHGRFWNHPIPPKAKNVEKYTYKGIPLNKPYTQFAIIQAMLKTFTHASSWSSRLSLLLDEWPLSIHNHMGFPADWDDLSFWDISSPTPPE